ncbi:MAG: hypothetical protein ABIW33_03415 [Sphingomicrobium sp.]
MLHLLSDSQPRPAPYAEAVARLASIRHALALVEPFGSGPACDPGDDDSVAAAFDGAGPARQRLFDARSSRLVGAAAAGIEALALEHRSGRSPNPQATGAMVAQIRRELAEVAGIVLA